MRMLRPKNQGSGVTSDALFWAGLVAVPVGIGGALALVYWDGAIDRWYAARRRKADRGWIDVR